jgi:hypothetical protein
MKIKGPDYDQDPNPQDKPSEGNPNVQQPTLTPEQKAELYARREKLAALKAQSLERAAKQPITTTQKMLDQLEKAESKVAELKAEREANELKNIIPDMDFVRKLAAAQRSLSALKKRIEDKSRTRDVLEKHTIKRRNQQFPFLKEGNFLKNAKNIARSQERSDLIVEREAKFLPKMSQKLSPRLDFSLRQYPEYHPEKHIVHAAPGLPIESLYKLTKEFESITIDAPLRKPIGEFVIALPPNTPLVSKEQGLWMAQRHMVRQGVDINQHDYIVIEHTEKAHQHFHVRYKRERYDGGYHHILGADHVCHLEAALQTKMFEDSFPEKPEGQKIGALTTYSKVATAIQCRLVNETLFAEIRYRDRSAVYVPVTGAEAAERVNALGIVDMASTGGLAKHLIAPKFRASHYLGVE